MQAPGNDQSLARLSTSEREHRGNVSVTYQDLESAGDRLKAGRVEIEGNLQQLKRLVDDLVSSCLLRRRALKSS